MAPTEYGEFGRCEATAKTTGEQCGQPAIGDHGKCYFHGAGGGPPDNNDNSETHGLTADAEKWFERHRDDCEDRIRLKVARAVEHVPFSWENLMKMDELVQAAINQEQVRKGDQYIRDKGIMRKETVPVGEGAVQQDEENPASLQKSRAQKDTIRILKELGYLDDPDTQQAEALEGGLDLTLSTEDKDALEAAFDTE